VNKKTVNCCLGLDGLLIPISILASLFGILIGLFLFLKPVLSIDIQRKFYEKINWRMEPISMQKEIRNTKIMGLFLICISLVNMVYILARTI